MENLDKKYSDLKESIREYEENETSENANELLEKIEIYASSFRKVQSWYITHRENYTTIYDFYNELRFLGFKPCVPRLHTFSGCCRNFKEL